ncbi:minichromosome maintenance family (MCM) [Galdieria sulphuraria]|uniref:DNA helicase n=1 Tax=Galdieria sulphuraria TaxID=130081 RepID=M2Y8I0_GALSU|nr:minichromosome maintenance family (MCM) [Galdieria sulphuraria]EME32154.1 minichromosome maintenance family (MCM) [Galdieria sulphuraria]|eukprot:XP_005708674.1 minichromosome maintenance family (MCM) [Galdieria sulphuraria]
MSSIKWFLEASYSDQILRVLQDSDLVKHYPILLDVTELLEFDQELFTNLVMEPEIYLPVFEDAIRLYEDEMLQKVGDDAVLYGYTFKEHIHVRPYHLPEDPLLYKKNVSSLRSSDVGHLISFRGTVIRTGSVLMRELQKTYQCSKCKHRFIVYSDITRGGKFELPTFCPSPSLEEPCRSNSYQFLEDTRSTDYQEIKIQERVQTLDLGSIPRSIVSALSDDLVDICKPGDDILITGVLKRLWHRNPSIDLRCELDLILDTTHVQVINEQKSHMEISDEIKERFLKYWHEAYQTRRPLEARDFIVESFCPRLFGLKTVKLILLTALIGGVCRPNREGTRVRGEIHVLLIGDPGTGKSQLLKEAASLSPRSISTTGIGSTHAGLTVTAVREASSGEWALESGALVLADGGLCCIDEFDGIKDRDRAAMHEVMEQQTLSVAKAGLVMTLDTRTTIFAAVNPKVGKMRSNEDLDLVIADPATELALSVGIAPPLLSRFDVTVTLLDKHEPEWDESLSEFILNGYRDHCSDSTAGLHTEYSKVLWNVEELQMYIYFVKEAIEPELTCNAQRIVSKYYTMQRQASSRNAARTTVRFLESLIRLTQAHARLLFRRFAIVQDAIYAIFVTESSAFGNDILQLPPNLQSGDSFESSDLWYEAYSQAVLQKMGLAETVCPNEYLNDHERLIICDLTKQSERRYSTGHNPTQTVFSVDATVAEKRKYYVNNRRISFQEVKRFEAVDCIKSDSTEEGTRSSKLFCEEETVSNKRTKVNTISTNFDQEEASASKTEAPEVDFEVVLQEKTSRENNETNSLQFLQELDEGELDSALLGSWMEPRNDNV